VTAGSSDRLSITTLLTGEELQIAMAEDVRRGLTAAQKSLPSKYFYDARGSELFEQITELPEYYQTRTELQILQSIAQPLAAQHQFADVVELGSGSSRKTLTLLDALSALGSLQRFVPLDVSEEMLRESAASLLQRYPALRVHGVVGDFQKHLQEVPTADGRRLVIFLGSTIGNLFPEERIAFLRSVRGLLGSGDRLLLGVDLVKDRTVLEAAYNDSAGVTAEFNRNVLRVVNAGLHADFAPERYRHYAPYNAEEQRIEMYLVAQSRQEIHVRDLDLEVAIADGEAIWTEISCKFTREGTEQELAVADLQLEQWLTDAEARFGLALAAPRW
jgi:L-histidine Nalpha-methyltransferase